MSVGTGTNPSSGSKLSLGGSRITSKKIETVTSLLEERILSREWSPKQSLPPQGQLSREYGVSLGTIAIAIRNLHQKHLVDIVPNKGAYVVGDTQRMNPGVAPSIGLRGSYVGSIGETSNVLVGDIVESSSARGSTLLMLPQSGSGEQYTLDYYRERGTRGVIFLGGEAVQEAYHLRASGFPVVLANKPIDPTSLSYVDYDHASSLKEVVRLFVKNGHQRIGVIFPHTSMPGYYDSLKPDFLMALDENGLSYNVRKYWRCLDPASKEESVEKIEELLTMPQAPTAIFAWSPKLAALTLKVAADLGLNIPRDISLAASCYESIQDIPVSGFVLPHQQLAQCLIEEIQASIDSPFHSVQKLIPLPYKEGGTIGKKKVKP